MGKFTTVTMVLHHIHTNPFTHLVSSAEELNLFQTEISMKELSLLALVDLLVLAKPLSC
jgi:hypothetical protein